MPTFATATADALSIVFREVYTEHINRIYADAVVYGTDMEVNTGSYGYKKAEQEMSPIEVCEYKLTPDIKFDEEWIDV